MLSQDAAVSFPIMRTGKGLADATITLLTGTDENADLGSGRIQKEPTRLR